MHRLLTEKGMSVRYTEVPGEGHHFITPYKNANLMDQFLLWMLSCRKERGPKHVTFVTYWLRHNKSYWVQVDQMQRYGSPCRIDARVADGNTRLDATTENVRAFSLGPITGTQTIDVRIDHQELGRLDLTNRQSFVRNKAGWQVGGSNTAGEKRWGRSGPISDLFFDNVIYVGGSTGSSDENHFTQSVASFMEAEFRRTNGGVHRGGIPGENSANQRVARDTELSDEEARGNQLILCGTDKTNALVGKYLRQLPLRFGEKSLELGGLRFAGDNVSVFAVFPHPENEARCLAIHGGVSPDAIVFGSHLHTLLLPDYIVYDRARVLAWGFWDNEWKPSK
jgi:hypothetical protein